MKTMRMYSALAAALFAGSLALAQDPPSQGAIQGKEVPPEELLKKLNFDERELFGKKQNVKAAEINQAKAQAAASEAEAKFKAVRDQFAAKSIPDVSSPAYGGWKQEQLRLRDLEKESVVK